MAEKKAEKKQEKNGTLESIVSKAFALLEKVIPLQKAPAPVKAIYNTTKSILLQYVCRSADKVASSFYNDFLTPTFNYAKGHPFRTIVYGSTALFAGYYILPQVAQYLVYSI